MLTTAVQAVYVRILLWSGHHGPAPRLHLPKTSDGTLRVSSTLSGVVRSFASHLGTKNRLHDVPFCARSNAHGSPFSCSLVKFATQEKKAHAALPHVLEVVF